MTAPSPSTAVPVQSAMGARHWRRQYKYLTAGVRVRETSGGMKYGGAVVAPLYRTSRPARGLSSQRALRWPLIHAAATI
ncbi:hypothetical protein [Nocardia sp. IFM 10818]